MYFYTVKLILQLMPNLMMLFWLLCAIIYVLYKLKKKKMVKALFIFTLLSAFIFSVSPLPVFMVRNLEQQYKPYNAKNTSQKLPILVLGSGHTNDPGVYPLQRLSESSIKRMTEGIRQYRLQNGGPVIFSGYSASNKMPQGEVMARAAVSLGISPKDTLMMIQPASTWDEAACYKKRFGTKKPFILVTSALHMPRAMKIFKRMGMQPIAAPTHYLSLHDPDNMTYNWKPSASKIICTDKSLHEYIGAIYYNWRDISK